jgi:hypothetical protein
MAATGLGVLVGKFLERDFQGAWPVRLVIRAFLVNLTPIRSNSYGRFNRFLRVPVA